MPTRVQVNLAQVEVTSVLLTPKVLKQIPRLSWSALAKGLTGDDIVLGWISGTALGHTRKEKFLLIEFGEGKYGLFCCLEEPSESCKQIYVP